MALGALFHLGSYFSAIITQGLLLNAEILQTCAVQIENIVCSERTEAKLESKHHVTLREARQVFFSQPRIRFAETGHTLGEDVYAAFGQTLGGRYLSVFFIYKPARKAAVVISARDMSDKERKAYGRK